MFKIRKQLLYFSLNYRCVVAARDIKAGELLLEDYPAVFGPKDQLLGIQEFMR